VTSTFPVGTFTVTGRFTPPRQLSFEWDPHLPKKGELSARVISNSTRPAARLLVRKSLMKRACGWPLWTSNSRHHGK
jgi:hypothetical protein